MSDSPELDRVAELAELGVLTASLIHELRQPLFAVKGRLQLDGLGGSLQPTDVQELLGHLSHIEELLDHYSAYGRIPAEPHMFDLRVPIQRALSMLDHRCRQLGTTIHADLPPDPLWLHAREMALRQVSVNLLQNALDAVSMGPDRQVWLTLRPSEGGATLWVEDTGAGVPEELVERVFQPFVTSKPAGHGTGLGLYIARRLVEEIGGTLTLEDREEGGTRARVEIPGT